MNEPPRPRLSLAVITRDEREDLPRLLDAAEGFADEVVVVDCGSTDGTVELARERGARVVQTGWPGYGIQKNRALDECRGEWLLSLDADEVPDPELAAALARVGDGGEAAGYEFVRRNHYLGEPIRHAWSADRIVRVVRRGRGRWTDAPVHEILEVDGSVETLPGELVHHPYRDLDDHMDKLGRYARLGAREAHAAGRTFHIHQLVTHPVAAFARRYLFRLGFLDGVRGLLVAASASLSAFLKYAHLFQLQRGRAGEHDDLGGRS